MTVGTVNGSRMSILPLMRMEHSAKMKVIWKVFHVLLLSVKYTARLVKSDSQMKHFFAQYSFLANEKKKNTA